MSDHVCETCGKSYKSRSGLWKHQKSKGHGKFASKESFQDNWKDHQDQTIPIEESQSSESASTPPNPVEDTSSGSDGTSFSWADFDFGSAETTDTIPTTLKSIVKPMPGGSGKLSKAQYEALENQNKGILKMGLTTIDVLLTKYGQAVSLDDQFEVKHSDSDKELVANAQWRYLEEKGLFLTNYLSTGMIAGSLSIWYVGQPLMRIRKNAKRKLVRGRLLSRIPLIGRFFKKKEEVAPIAQNVEEVEL